MNYRKEVKTAIHFAQEAYKLWLYNGVKKAGFSFIDLEVIRYVYQHEGITVAMKSNGALVFAGTETECQNKEWR